MSGDSAGGVRGILTTALAVVLGLLLCHSVGVVVDLFSYKYWTMGIFAYIAAKAVINYLFAER